MEAFVKEYFIALLIIGILVIRLLSNRFKRGLTSIPGPTFAKYTDLWKLVDLWKGQPHRTAIALHQKHGDLVRIAPNDVSVGDPKAISEIYGLNKGYSKTHFYPIQSIVWEGKVHENLFSTRDEAWHRSQKKAVAGAYSMTHLLERESGVDSCTELLVNRLRTWAENGEKVDLGTWLQYYAFDIVGEFNFSAKFGFLENGDIENIMPKIRFRLKYAAMTGQIPISHKFLLGNPLFNFFMPSMEKWDQVLKFTLKAMSARTSLHKDGEIERKQAEGPNGREVDILGRWLDVHEADPEKLSTKDMIVHLTTNVFAGSDTTAISLRSIFYQLLRNPEKYAKLKAEIDEAERKGKLSEYISYRESTTHLPYTSAVIREGMRLHPAVGLLLERYVPTGGATICGQYLPRGTLVGVNAWVVQYNPKVFTNPDEFIPERWIESTADHLKEMEQSLFYFGAGSRTCIGKNISIIEIHKIVPQLVREFDFRLHDPGKEWKTMCAGVVLQEGLEVDVVDRRKG